MNNKIQSYSFIEKRLAFLIALGISGLPIPDTVYATTALIDDNRIPFVLAEYIKYTREIEPEFMYCKIDIDLYRNFHSANCNYTMNTFNEYLSLIGTRPLNEFDGELVTKALDLLFHIKLNNILVNPQPLTPMEIKLPSIPFCLG